VRLRLVAFVALALAIPGLAACSTPITVVGEIDDNRISVNNSIPPPDIWVELHNVGSKPCQLAVVLASVDPGAIPVEGGQGVIDGNTVVDILEVAEIDGEAATERPVVVDPGETVRVQIAFEEAVEQDRVILCNGPGDYAAGRYVALPFS
jgi:hypothetical protein